MTSITTITSILPSQTTLAPSRWNRAISSSSYIPHTVKVVALAIISVIALGFMLYKIAVVCLTSHASPEALARINKKQTRKTGTSAPKPKAATISQIKQTPLTPAQKKAQIAKSRKAWIAQRDADERDFPLYFSEPGLPNFTTASTNNTCFLNSSLMLIYNTPELMQLILDSTVPDDDPIKASLLALFEALNNRNKKNIRLAKDTFSTAFLTSSIWTSTGNDGRELGTTQDSMGFLRKLLDTLRIDEKISRFTSESERVHVNARTNETYRRNPIPYPANNIPIINISPTDTIQDVLNRDWLGKPIEEKEEGFSVVTIIDDIDNTKEITVKEMFAALLNAHVISGPENEQQKKELLKILADTKRFPSSHYTDRPLLLNLFLEFLHLKKLEDLEQSYLSTEHVDSIVTKGKKIVTSDISAGQNTLIFEIAQQDQGGRIQRADGKFTPEDIITVHGQRYKLTGVINRPGAHYTFLRRNLHTWTQFSDSIVSSIRSLEEISGKGTALRGLIYEKNDDVSAPSPMFKRHQSTQLNPISKTYKHLDEIRDGKQRGPWTSYIFPQHHNVLAQSRRGVLSSLLLRLLSRELSMNEECSMRSKQDAIDFLNDPELKKMYMDTCKALLDSLSPTNRTLRSIFKNNTPKVISSLTLFAAAAESSDPQHTDLLNLINEIHQVTDFEWDKITTSILALEL